MSTSFFTLDEFSHLTPESDRPGRCDAGQVRTARTVAHQCVELERCRPVTPPIISPMETSLTAVTGSLKYQNPITLMTAVPQARPDGVRDAHGNLFQRHGQACQGGQVKDGDADRGQQTGESIGEFHTCRAGDFEYDGEITDITSWPLTDSPSGQNTRCRGLMVAVDFRRVRWHFSHVSRMRQTQFSGFFQRKGQLNVAADHYARELL